MLHVYTSTASLFKSAEQWRNQSIRLFIKLVLRLYSATTKTSELDGSLNLSYESGNRSFAYNEAAIWNSLPAALQDSRMYDTIYLRALKRWQNGQLSLAQKSHYTQSSSDWKLTYLRHEHNPALLRLFVTHAPLYKTLYLLTYLLTYLKPVVISSRVSTIVAALATSFA